MFLSDVAVLLLCLFASMLIVARTDSSARIALCVPGVVAGVLLASFAAPGIATLAIVAGIATAAQLLGNLNTVAAPLLAGLCAGLGVAGVFAPSAFGAIAWFVLPLAFVAPLSSVLLARRAGFAPQALCDQGQCAVLIAAPVIAALPGARSGWQSALALGGTSLNTAPPSGWWWFALPLLAFGFGALRQWWVRK